MMKFLVLTLLVTTLAETAMARRAPGPKVGGQATVLVSASHGGGDSYTLCQNATSGVTYPCNMCGLSVVDPSDMYECK